MQFDMPLKIGYCGETKIGKSYLAASFIQELDGVLLDFAGVQQVTDRKSAPTYDVSRLAKGEAFRACKTVGLGIDTQYRFIKSWDDLEAAITYARTYRDDISKKKNRRVWLVIDDTATWRWHEALHALKISGHKSLLKDDWGMTTTNMTLRMRALEAEFNLLFVNTMTDVFQNGENTGQRVGKYYPNGLEFALDAVGTLWIDRSKKPFVQHFRVDANRASWICLDSYVEDIINPTPRVILQLLGIDETLW